MNRLSLARVLDRTEAASYILERFVYRSIDKMPERAQDPVVKTLGKGAKHSGHAVRVAIEKVWQRWG